VASAAPSPLDETLAKAPLKVGLYLFFLALAVRVVYLSQYANSPFFWVPALDSLYHDLHAQAIAAGRDDGQAFFRAPFYAYFLGGVYKVFGHSFWAARGVQAVIGSLSCVLLYQLGRRLFRPVVGLLAAVAMALYAPLVFFDGELHSPVLEVFLDLAFLLLALRAGERDDRRLWLAAGLVLGLSAITRPNVLVAVPVVLVWLAFSRVNAEGRSKRVAAAGLVLAGAALLPALVTLRNYRVSSDRVFIASQGGINLFLGNRPEADGFTPTTPKRYAFEGEYADSVALYGQRAAEEALGRPLPASQAQAYWLRRVLHWWRADPMAALRLTAKKAVLAWTHREIRNNHAFDFVRAEFAPALWACPFGFWFAGPFGLVGMVLAWRSHPRTRLLALFSLAYVASFVLFFVADRYRLPVIPPLLLFAAYALVWGWERWRAGEKRRLAPAAALLAASALLVGVDWFRTATPATWALDHWSAGNRWRTMGRFPEAEAQYRRALALDPQNADFWTNLGAVQFYTRRFTEAAESFRQALRLQPASGSGYYNLAMCELELGAPAQAHRNLERAVRLDPEHRPAREELARLRGGGVSPPE